MDYQLWDHQKEAISASRGRDHFALFFEMGTGKTATTINILKRHRGMKTLIFCPLVVMENWKREFIKFDPDTSIRDICVLEGSGKKRLETFNYFIDRGNIIIVNYESLIMKDLYNAMMKWQPEVIVFDESHKIKNPQAKRTKLAIALADLAKYKYLLSGTPILNSPIDLFSQFRAMDGGKSFGKNFIAFRNRFFHDKNASMPRSRYFPNWQPKSTAMADFNRIVHGNGRVVKKDECLDLPPFVRKTVYTPLTGKQHLAYESMRKDFLAWVEGEAVVAQLAVTKALRLLQIVSGFVATEDGDVKTFDGNPRAAALKELLEEITTHAKVIVWAVFRENYRQIREVCSALDLGTVEVHGDITARHKNENVDRFNNDPTCKVLIGHPGAGGIGINLVAASYSIWYSRSFSLEHDLQAEARNYRGGSQRHDKITRIDLVTPETIDEVVMERLSKKLSISDKILMEAIRNDGR